MRTETGRWLSIFCLAALSCSELASAQRIDALGPQVRKYVRVGTSKDGAGYDTRKLLDSVKGHYGEY